LHSLIFKDTYIYIINMNFIKSIIQKYTKENKKVLGRWNMEYCNKKMNNKIDLSNEDHCGPCGQYVLDKMKITTYKSTNNK
jgi:hypothetical protein